MLALFIAFGALAQNPTKKENPRVYHIQNYFTEAYLVKGNSDKLILIETGVSVAGYQDSLVSSIKKLGFEPENIALAIVTHGHCDHAGNARFLQEKYHIAIAGSKYDMEKFTSGKTELGKCEDVSIWGERLRPYLDLGYQPFTPDVVVGDHPVDLTMYGVSGKIVPMKGGHTPGDLLVLIGDNLFVGDAFLGTFKAVGGTFYPDGHHVREHFWHEKRGLADQNLKLIDKIATDNKVTMLYPTHNGPVAAHELTRYIKEEPLLKLFSKLVPDMLSDALKGESESHQASLADNFIFHSPENVQYTKAAFMESFISHPTSKLESLTAEDFRVVSSDNSTVVMTYIQSSKPVGKDASTFLVTNTYSRTGSAWKLLFTQARNQ